MDVNIAVYKNERIPKKSLIGVLVPQEGKKGKKWVWFKSILKEHARLIELIYENYPLGESIKWATAIQDNEKITIIICLTE
ncbi:MAG: hypothetical protein WC472_03620 [Candidatus Paceibacterota bacterium]